MTIDILKLSEYLASAVEAASRSGKILRSYWGKIYEIQEKTLPGNLVTEADKASEEQIIQFLKSRYPSFGINAEESGTCASEESDFIWVIDPLDGTTNFTHQFPMVSISIGLLYRGAPVLGVIYNPIFEELFEGAKGKGAYLNKRPISVSTTKDIAHSLLVTGFAYNRKQTDRTNYTEFCHMTHMSQGVRRMGSAALDLAYVAAGRFDGFWESGLQAWDVSAGIAIVQEAGGMVTAHDGSPIDLYSGEVLATNGVIHSAISSELIALRTATH